MPIGGAIAAEFNELRESYRVYLRKFTLDGAMALSLMVMTRFEELIVGADTITAATIYNAVMRVTSRMEDEEIGLMENQEMYFTTAS